MDTHALSPITIRLKQFREERQLSQAELARRSGVPQSTISRIEGGDTGSISLANLEQLAEALQVNAALLIVHQAQANSLREPGEPCPECLKVGEDGTVKSRKPIYERRKGTFGSKGPSQVRVKTAYTCTRGHSWEERFRPTVG